MVEPGFVFLSTLSLRRATIDTSKDVIKTSNFYPRSPCGERQHQKKRKDGTRQFLSTLSLRRATRFRASLSAVLTISIHALLAESDREPTALRTPHQRFLSTLSLRRATCMVSVQIGGNVNFYPRSPCGERHSANCNCRSVHPISIHALLAESDLSGSTKPRARRISIHALLAESDPNFR